MTEEQIKMLCKFAVEHGNRPFTREEKEIIKQLIDNSRNMNELFTVALATWFKQG